LRNGISTFPQLKINTHLAC